MLEFITPLEHGELCTICNWQKNCVNQNPEVESYLKHYSGLT